MSHPLALTLPSIAVKAIADDGWRIGGYAVLFGSPDQRDLTGDYFTKGTDFALNWYPRRPILFDHAQDQHAQAALIGSIESAEIDELGVWIEGQLDRRNRYAQKVRELVMKGALGWSSGSLAHVIRKHKNGEITRWPLCEFSVTAVPAEPRTLAVPLKHLRDESTAQEAYKSLHLSMDKWFEEQSMPGIQSGTQVTTQTQDANSQMQNAINSARQEIDALKALINRPTKALPLSGTYSPRVEVGDELRYANMTSSDVMFMSQFLGDVAAKDSVGRTAIGRYARQFVSETSNDPERRMERRMAAKALREFAHHEQADQLLSLLPYKSLAAVDSNDYRPADLSAIKSNELDSVGQTNYVSDWVPYAWSQQIILRQCISNPMLGLLTRVDMPTNPFYLPIESADPTVYYMVEGTDAAMLVLGSPNTAAISKIKSNKLTMTATKLGVRLGYSTEVAEDALPFLMTQFNRQMSRSLQNGIDDTLINGDVATGANTNVNLL